ncbi:MAG: helix-turn-helix domain-containing protein, partial [Chloroflexota bacterium]|nr:helix-turn-helix domain-containing protein [Chloroflexota bacterium]
MASFGETLKQARAHKGVTLKEAEQATRINRNHLAALEDENFAALPPLIYQRGIVRNYALYLDLDPARTLSMFEDTLGLDDSTTAMGVAPVPPVNMPSHWAPNFAVIAFAVVLSTIVFAWGYSAFVQPTGEEPGITEVVPTVTPFASDVPLPTPTPIPPTPTPTAEATQAPAPERIDSGRTDAPPPTEDGGGDNQLNQQAQTEDITAVLAGEVAEPVDEVEDAAAPTTGAYVTSISITAMNEPITVSMVADGVAVFEGQLQPGESTDFYDGSVFEVFTSSGANTEFTNSCGTPFNMGYEPGEAFYILN